MPALRATDELNPDASTTRVHWTTRSPFGVLAFTPDTLSPVLTTPDTLLLTMISAPSLAASVARYWKVALTSSTHDFAESPEMRTSFSGETKRYAFIGLYNWLG